MGGGGVRSPPPGDHGEDRIDRSVCLTPLTTSYVGVSSLPTATDYYIFGQVSIRPNRRWWRGGVGLLARHRYRSDIDRYIQRTAAFFAATFIPVLSASVVLI